MGRSPGPVNRGTLPATMDRRQFLHRAVTASAGGAVMGMLPATAAIGQTAEPGESPYGPLAAEPDENGLLLPEGFTSRIIGVAGEPVADTGYAWHAFPDGAATYPTDDGWIYVCNSEVFDFLAPEAGGASAVRFATDGSIVEAYRVLEGSNSNCAGGPTPWGTWLSCEENFAEQGRVWECDPTGAEAAVAHPAMGLFAHEAVAVDPESETLYLTQDNPEGLLYRYTPTAYPDLSAGVLEACIVADDNTVTWQEVPDPGGASTPTRQQVPGATLFNGGEGIWYHDGWIWFTTKGDHSVHGIELAEQRYELLWRGDPDGLGIEGAVLSGVDNLTVEAATGDLYVAEDGGNMEVVVITGDGVVAPFARVAGAEHEGSEVTGPCFDPSGQRLYFSSQRGPTPKPVGEIVPGITAEIPGGGITWEVSGPFRGREDEPATPTTTIRQAGSTGDDDGSDSSAVPIGIGVAVAAAAIGGTIALRRRRGTDDS
jgi:secreted PhoX family phosphatase